MNTNFSNINGEVTFQMEEYYKTRAKGGCGLIVVDATSVDPQSKKHGLQPMLYDEKYIPGYGKLTEKIHRYGARASIEIIHYGSETPYPNGIKHSASDVSSIPENIVVPYTKKEIIEVEDKFVHTAELAKIAGFDAVTYHATHGYLIAQFLSPLYNRRQDEYGGNLENRCRFLVEIIQKTRSKLGDDFPIIVRFSADEYIAGGRTIEESISIAKILEKSGVSAIDISAAVPSSYMFTIAPGTLTGMEGLQRDNAKAIKNAVNIPVIVAGGIRTPELAEELLAGGCCDFVCIGRGQIADPDYVNKLVNNERNRIRPCISCLTCFYSLGKKKCLCCAVNPEAGREYDINHKIDSIHSEKISIVGGGPAGMQAALTLAGRGSEVHLYERSSRLGGSIYPASIPFGKEKFMELVSWYTNELTRAGVKIHLNEEYTTETDKELNPEIIIDATGVEYSRRIPGSDNPCVITAIEALTEPERVGDKAIIIGGGNTGCETAEVLSNEGLNIEFIRVTDFTGHLEYEAQREKGKKNRRITLIEYLPAIGGDIGKLHKPIMEARLKEGNVSIFTSTAVQQIYENGDVDILDLKTRSMKKLHADTVILAGGMCNRKFRESFPERRVISIGDAQNVGKIESAIKQAYFIGNEL